MNKNLSLQKLDELSETPPGEFTKDDRDHLISELKVDVSKGLNSSRVEELRQQYGRNYIEPRPPPMYLTLLFAAFQDTTIIMLLIAMVVQGVFAFTIEKTVSSYIEVGAILATILLVTNVAAFMDWRKAQRFYELNNKVSEIQVSVLRDGQRHSISMWDIVVGDVVFVAVGDMPCADGILVECADIKIDESSLTGESDFVPKNLKSPVIFSGTSVMEGSGKMVVVGVGQHSRSGKIRVLIHNIISLQKLSVHI